MTDLSKAVERLIVLRALLSTPVGDNVEADTTDKLTRRAVGGGGEVRDAAPPPAEAPCFECGSTERVGTACAPCNPEITDPNFGAEAPLTVEEVRSAVHAWIREDAGMTVKFGMFPDVVNKLIDRIMTAMGRAG